MRWRHSPLFLALLVGELVLVGCCSFAGKPGTTGLASSRREGGSPPMPPSGDVSLSPNTGQVLLSVPGMT